MKKELLFCLLVLLVCPVNAQPRVVGQQQFKILKSSAIVTNIVGWAFDKSEDKWAGYYNTIDPTYKRGNNKVPIRTTAEHMSVCKNIVSLQTKKLSYKDTIYYAIVEVYWHSGFDYPSIYEGFYKYKNRAIYLFDSEEYSKLYNLDNQVTILNEYYIFAHEPASISLTDQLKDMFNVVGLERTRYPYKVYFKREDENTVSIRRNTRCSSCSFVVPLQAQ